jgi:hypothetical protein
MSGRTTWWSKDAAWWRRGRIVEVGQEHGAAGPAVVDWLTCEAKSQGPLRGHDGTVKAGFAAIAHGCFIDGTETVRAIVNTCVEVGLLDDFEDDGRTLTCRISGWEEDVERPLATTRKAAQRANTTERDNGGQPGTEGDNGGEGSICPPTETETSTNPNPSARAAVKFGGRIVPQFTVIAAELILADFNRREGTGYRPLTSTGKPTEDFKRILGALIENPDVTAEQGIAVNAAGLNGDRFWQGKAHPGVVWGPGVIARNLEQVRATNSSVVDDDFARRKARDHARTVEFRRRVAQAAIDSDAEPAREAS